MTVYPFHSVNKEFEFLRNHPNNELFTLLFQWSVFVRSTKSFEELE